MIIRNSAIRHGRALLPPRTRSSLRSLSTEVKSDSPAATSATDAQWAPEQASGPVIGNLKMTNKKKKKLLETHITTFNSDGAHQHSGKAWTESRMVGKDGKTLTPAEQFKEFQRIQSNTRGIGSKVTGRYRPTELLQNPTAAQDVSLELLMASQTHMGHNKALWNPANSRYMYGTRAGVNIISLEVTLAHLRRAARVVEETTRCGGIVLFVGTRKRQMEIVTRAAELAGAFHCFTKWVPGGITNRDVILKGKVTSVFDEKDQKVDGFKIFGSIARPLMPDLVVCLNPQENYPLLYECGLKSIPTIGIIDTDTNPTWVTYTIPANDDSFRSVSVIAGALGLAGQAGQKRRKAEAAEGKIHWSTPVDLSNFIASERKYVKEKREEVLHRLQANVIGFTDEEQKLLLSNVAEKDYGIDQRDVMAMLSQTVGDASLEESTETPEAVGSRIAAAFANVQQEMADVVESAGQLEDLSANLETSQADVKQLEQDIVDVRGTDKEKE